MHTIIDWWRVWFAFLFVFVYPFSAKYIQASFEETLGEKNIFIMFFALPLFMLKKDPYLSFEAIHNPALWPYFAVIALLYIHLLAQRFLSRGQFGP